MEITLTINGQLYKISPNSVPIDTSLNEFIRNHAKLTGTKFMCLEGGCGACIVTAIGEHPETKEKSTWAVNSCLQNVYSCHGLDILTVEGIGSKKFGMHKVQSRLANFNGTQCGFCSPGMVMNMYSLLESKDGKVTQEEVENSFGGNICRCTGYRPILDAFKSLAVDADKDLLEACKDIEDLNGIKSCPKTGKACAGSCSANKVPKQTIRLEFEENKEWIKVYTVDEIFASFAKMGDKPYMLVAGNTAHGVYRRSPKLQSFIDISDVQELRGFKLDSSLELGGNVSLTEAMQILAKVATQKASYQYLKELVKHIDLIANVPVRNNGTLAGNLMIKNAHKEFPSDLFLILEAAGATLTIAESTSKFSSVSPKEFLQLDMNKKIILKISLPPLDPTKVLFRSFKIMPRAQNAHAYVNAAFLVELDNAKDKVVSARLCFGGINPSTIHAEKTEQYLIGKGFFSNETLQGALNILETEINPDYELPDASPEYRKNLALGLFYKFYLKVAPENKSDSKFRSGGKVLDRGVSSGKQEFDTYEKNWPLTKNIQKIEADVQVTGEAKYVNDFPILPNQVYAAFVLGTQVHAKIKSINADPALKIPGVVAFYSAKDIPGKNTFAPTKIFVNFKIEEIFCSEEILYHGQPIGIILADTMKLANYAAEFVEVTYEPKDPSKKILSTLKDVLAEESSRVVSFPHASTKSVESGSDTVHTIKGHMEQGLQYHYTMETQSCVVVPIEDGLDVYSSTQWMDIGQMAIADALNIPNSLINMQVRRVGGAYGGKSSRSGHISCAAAVAAFLLNRPVRFVMTLEQNMSVVGKRYACINDYEVEIDGRGLIQKFTNDFVEDYGCTPNEPVFFHTAQFVKNCYDTKYWNINVNAAITDSPSNTFCRAPGTTEGVAMTEYIMEHIAWKLNKDPVDVRMANIPEDSELKKILPEFVQSVEYYERKRAINDFNNNNRWVKRGIAIVPLKYPLYYFGSMHAMVSIYHGDGSVAITHGAIEMGQGLNTKVAQTAAHILGLSLDKISIKPSNSMTAPNDIVTAASIGSDISCFAVKNACEILLERLKPVREENPTSEWAELIDKAHAKNVDLAATYFYKASDMTVYNIWAASCCELEIDLLTGNVLLKRIDITEDLGESMSPGIDVGQVEGAFIMGVGYWLNEAIIYNKENGELLTNRTWTYKPPGAKDIPVDFRIKFLKNSSNPFGVLRSKSSGEPATAMAVVVVNALRHALDSARKDSGIKDDIYYHLGAPTTPENIFLAANNLKEQFMLN